MMNKPKRVNVSRRSVVEPRVNYIDVEKDEKGWADADKWLPDDFDLCWIKVKGRARLLSGWFSGYSWDGSQLKNDDVVEMWKRKFYDDECDER